MPKFRMEHQMMFDSIWIRNAALGLAASMVIADGYENGAAEMIPDFKHEWSLTEWAALPLALSILLTFVRFRMGRVRIKKVDGE